VNDESGGPSRSRRHARGGAAGAEPGTGEVLLRVNVTSICGTDVKVLHRKLLGQPRASSSWATSTRERWRPSARRGRIHGRRPRRRRGAQGCERCENCIKGWYTSCLNYGNMAKGHRAKGLTCDGGFAEYAVNHVNTLYKLPDNLTFEQACMVTTAASRSGRSISWAATWPARRCSCRARDRSACSRCSSRRRWAPSA
jgi:hypothetical protein